MLPFYPNILSDISFGIRYVYVAPGDISGLYAVTYRQVRPKAKNKGKERL